MSFSEVTLERAFEEEKDKDGKTKKLRKNGFLPPMIQKVSTSSALFRHIRRNYLHKKPEHGWMSEVKTATYEKTLQDGKKEVVPIPGKAKDSLLIVFYKTALSFHSRGGKNYEFYNVVNTPQDMWTNSREDERNYISMRGQEGNIPISKDLFRARPQWAKNAGELDKMSYEEFAEKIDNEDAKSLGINDAKDNEVEAVKALWKLSRIISELGRLMIPPAKDGKEYKYSGDNLYSDERNLFMTSYVLKRNYMGDDIVPYTQEDKWRILQLGKQLKELNDKWDFTGLYIGWKTAAGYTFQGTDDYTRTKYSFPMPLNV